MKNGKRKVKIPNPHESNEVHASLLEKILKQAGITEAQWMSAVRRR
jgi:predicted RNA binding protein YcfA (HicA-like mRNA interferase family)